ncbi:E3 ubiquitin/ISG15 ligase TRIM25-like [Dendropsophus ebraccatus]|uniref:E3 ubiquitin/ISG15 ligase TRIM25-like n=1 Tax=Dendropsophus ebraccatus TaxID=150705 RepID=UPI003831D1DA
MASANLRDELLCSICLNTFTDPLTLRCGHNFCRGCIDQVLNMQDGSGVYFCPECREEFPERPTLQRNITLRNVAERLRSTQPHEEEITGICCTYCIHSPVPAVRSCLLCEASLCDNHLRYHSKSPEHVLTDPSTSLEKRKCSVHKKVLEYYCTEDTACICVYCLVEEHFGHRVEKLDEASERRKNKLTNVLQKKVTERKKTEERVRSVEEHWRKAQEKASGEAERVTALFIDIRRRLDDLEKKVLSEISRQEEQLSLSLSDVIQKLEIKKSEMTRKIKHIEELCNMADPLTVLQDPDTGDLCDPEEKGGDEDTGRHDKTHDVNVDVIKGIIHAGTLNIMTYLHIMSAMKTQPPDVQSGGAGGMVMTVSGRQKQLELISRIIQNLEKKKHELSRTTSPPQASPVSATEYGGDGVIVRTGGAEGKGAIYAEGPVDILLDVNTAANNLLISDDHKTATWTKTRQNRPETTRRFESYQVMSIGRVSSGQHYWDVEIRGSRRWRVGMCYPSIYRRGDQSHIGGSNKSWCLCRDHGLFSMFYNNYSVTHGGNWIQLSQQISTDRVRIYLDYEAGKLSFYELCDPIRHIYTCTATFTEPLHAALYVGNGFMKISGRSRIRYVR